MGNWCEQERGCFLQAGFRVAAWRGIGWFVIHLMVKVSTNAVRMHYSSFALGGGLPTVSRNPHGHGSILGNPGIPSMVDLRDDADFLETSNSTPTGLETVIFKLL